MCVCMRVMALYPNCQMESINGMERKRDGQFHRLGFSGDPRARATLTLTCAQRTCVSGLTSCRSAGCNWNQFHFTMELATNNANNNDNNNNSVPIWHSCTREVSGCAARSTRLRRQPAALPGRVHADARLQRWRVLRRRVLRRRVPRWQRFDDDRQRIATHGAAEHAQLPTHRRRARVRTRKLAPRELRPHDMCALFAARYEVLFWVVGPDFFFNHLGQALHRTRWFR